MYNYQPDAFKASGAMKIVYLLNCFILFLLSTYLSAINATVLYCCLMTFNL